MILSKISPGWSLKEIKKLSFKERNNWFELSREYQTTLRKNANE